MSRTKRVLDLALGLPLLVATIPVLACIGLAQRLTGDRGSLLFRATRVGEGGQPIQVLKVRTMREGAAGPPVTRLGDTRITAIGHWLRRTKLDELPQLANVVRGEMSLVGPRPESPEFVDWSDPVHVEVFLARPGMTGLSQLRFADEEALHVGSDYQDRYRRVVLPQKVHLDQWYVRHQTLRLDAKILLATAALMLRRFGTGGGRAKRLRS